MKDYYQILGVPEDADAEEIRSSFRKLAFQHHPDKNPGNERESEHKFKEINEAYSVIGDEPKRREYDAFRNGNFAGAEFNQGYRGFQYNQEDIFRNAFSNQTIFEELSRMFAQMGLRFDEDFRNETFFGGKGVRFRFYSTSEGANRSHYRYQYTGVQGNETPPASGSQPALRKPNFAERMAGKAINKLGKYALRKAFGIDLDLPPKGEDIHKELRISKKEASGGCRKKVKYKRGKEKKSIEVTVPAGIIDGKKIRLTGMGEPGVESGDLYLLVRIK